MIELLLDSGADPNGCGGSGSRGETPLHHLGYAAYENERGVMEAVQLLLRRGRPHFPERAARGRCTESVRTARATPAHHRDIAGHGI